MCVCVSDREREEKEQMCVCVFVCVCVCVCADRGGKFALEEREIESRRKLGESKREKLAHNIIMNGKRRWIDQRESEREIRID